MALGAWAASVGRPQRPPEFWRGQGLAPQTSDASSSELLSFRDLISLLGCVNHELTEWECTFRWLPLRSLLVPISTVLTSTSVHSQFSTEKPRVTELQARCDWPLVTASVTGAQQGTSAQKGLRPCFRSAFVVRNQGPSNS